MTGLKVYKASAGSGKTYTLALEYIKELLCQPVNNYHRRILAVTFTKDATGEMKERILAELYGLAFKCKDSENFLQSVKESLKEIGKPMSDAAIQAKALAVLKEILHDYSYLHITTIDAFFQKVLRNLAREMGKGSKFNLETNSFKVLSDAVSAMIENSNENPQLLDWLTTYIEEKLEEGNNWHIQQDILDFSQCIFNEYFQEHEDILKKQLNENPKIFEQLWKQHAEIREESNAFLKKTYSEICSILESTGLTFSDFNRNGTVINFIKKLSEGDFSGANPHAKTIQDCLINAEKWPSGKNPRSQEIILLAQTNLIPLLKQCIETLITYNTSRMITDNIYQLGLIWDITKEISRLNEENNRFMLADTAQFLNQMIDDSDSSFVFEKIGAEIKHVMIDEFQDTSRIQWKNFKSLLSNILAYNDFSMLVGDVKQSIYRWRNGDWSILNSIEKELPVEIQNLSFNFRSEYKIVDFNNCFFSQASTLLNEKFNDIFNDVSSSPFPTAYQSQDLIQQSTKKKEEGYVSIDFIPAKTEENSYTELVLEKLLNQLQELYHLNVSPDEICILTRTNKHIALIASYLAEQREKHHELSERNYLNIVSGEAFRLNSSPAIRIIIEALKTLIEPENAVHKAQLRIFINKYVNKSPNNLREIIQKEKSIPEIENDREQLSRMPLFELIDHLYRSLDLKQIEKQSNYMFAFYDAVNNYLKNYSSDIHAFIKFWDDELQNHSVPAETGVEGIRAMTIHKSKGLQFHTVLIPFCDWDLYPEKNPVIWCGPKENLYELELLPVKYSKKMYETVFLSEYKEETGLSWMDNLNLLYVGFTRPERNLMIIAKQKKKLAGLEDIKTASDLLQYTVVDLDGTYNEDTLHFETGILSKAQVNDKKTSDNLLKNTPDSFEISFVSNAFNPEKSIFKQSGKSKEFTENDEQATSRNEYIMEGNIMHALFSGIYTQEDIPAAVDRLAIEGIIHQEEKTIYEKEIRDAITESKVEDWFSDKYQIRNECSILIEENDTITSKRPDRVLTNSSKTIIIDYKFGEPHQSHQKQMKEYILLMQQMGYPDIQAYLWYVKKKTYIFVPLN